MLLKERIALPTECIAIVTITANLTISKYDDSVWERTIKLMCPKCLVAKDELLIHICLRDG